MELQLLEKNWQNFQVLISKDQKFEHDHILYHWLQKVEMEKHLQLGARCQYLSFEM